LLQQHWDAVVAVVVAAVVAAIRTVKPNAEQSVTGFEIVTTKVAPSKKAVGGYVQTLAEP